MHNFDEELPSDELSFVAGGRTYTMIWAPAKVLADIEDEGPADTAELTTQRFRDRIASFLQPADRKAWVAAVDDGTVPFRVLKAVYERAWDVQTGRPTTPPSPSASGDGGTEATSSAARGSSARAAVRTRRASRR